MMVSRVVRRTTDLLRGNFLVIVGLACMLEALQKLLSINPYSILGLLWVSGFTITAATILALLALLMGLVSQALLQGFVAAALIADRDGRKANLLECVRLGMTRLLPLLVVTVLSSLAVICGLVMLVVPGLLIATIWFVAAPVAAFEKVGPIEALGRSQDLAGGVRWQIFGLLFVTGAIVYLLSLIAAPMALAPIFQGSGIGAVIGVLLSIVSSGLTTSITAAIAGATYIELCDLHGGGPAADLGKIFQ